MKPSDRVVRQVLSRLSRADRRPGLFERIEYLAVARQAARWRGAEDAALREGLTTAAQWLLRHGVQGPPLWRAAAIVREMTRRKLGLWLHPVQITAGLALLRGRIVEMATGEGKTVTVLVPAVIAASMRFPVHIVTVNDYLSARDHKILRPVLDAFGLTSAAITEDVAPHLRAGAHDTDVVFTTNTSLTFDYLRDRVAHGADRSALAELAQARLGGKFGRAPRNLGRGLGFAVLDEVDSVLIDEAQTPLIITAERQDGETRGRAERLMLHFAASLQADLHFRLHGRTRRVELLPAVDPLIAGWQTTEPALASETARRDMLGHALSALHFYHRDDQYILTPDGIEIIDEYTGRVMPDRQWQQGLHQMIEAKEEVARSADRETLAQITYQAFFNRFLWFAGMTGTAREIAPELRTSYGRAVLRLPTHRRMRLRFRSIRLYRTSAARWRAVAREAGRIAGQGRPVLIGTRSVAASEYLSDLLKAEGLAHVVLNARQDAQEAEIVAQAGTAGQITVATNMAGRGTDIPVSPAVEARGGLHVILTEFHTSARIDRQLIGRTARQGQRGSAAAFVSLEDPLFVDMAPRLTALLRGAVPFGTRLPGKCADLLRNVAQSRAERQGQRQRRATTRQAERLRKSYGFRHDRI
ncbi:translocase [Limimaricola sp.]|uniref:preprotein translocase subunit SecA n=1 Tax=Limimaricola sp. TaxID=2211665 RepID=UPI0025C3B3ED|nr:translocase [Limimaricola sp.]